MSSDFFSVEKEDLEVADKLVFRDKEIVRFVCTDFLQNAAKGSLMLKVNVLSGDHSGKKTTIYMTSNDTEVSKKVKAQFLKAFWSQEEILARQANPKKLLGREFTAQSRVSNKEAKGDMAASTFQNWEQFTDVGPAGGQPVPTQTYAPAAPAPAQQPYVAPPAPPGSSGPSF